MTAMTKTSSAHRPLARIGILLAALISLCTASPAWASIEISYLYDVGSSTAAPTNQLISTVYSNQDSDGDGLTDARELTLGTNRFKVDSDGDGLSDSIEVEADPITGRASNTDPNQADTDGDGIVDGLEDANHNGMVDAGESDPTFNYQIGFTAQSAEITNPYVALQVGTIKNYQGFGTLTGYGRWMKGLRIESVNATNEDPVSCLVVELRGSGVNPDPAQETTWQHLWLAQDASGNVRLVKVTGSAGTTVLYGRNKAVRWMPAAPRMEEVFAGIGSESETLKDINIEMTTSNGTKYPGCLKTKWTDGATPHTRYYARYKGLVREEWGSPATGWEFSSYTGTAVNFFKSPSLSLFNMGGPEISALPTGGTGANVKIQHCIGQTVMSTYNLLPNQAHAEAGFWFAREGIVQTDSDSDGIPNWMEDKNQNGNLDAGETDPFNRDSDGDGIQDGTELGLTVNDIGPDTDRSIFQPDLDPSVTTDPTRADTDDDGLSDGREDANHDGRTLIWQGETDPALSDRAYATKSEILTNPFVWAVAQSKLIYTGYGALAGSSRAIYEVGTEVVSQTRCKRIRLEETSGSTTITVREVWLAQDVNGAVWLHREMIRTSGGMEVSTDYAGVPVLWMPADPIVGQVFGLRGNESFKVIATGVDLGPLSTGLGPYSGVLQLLYTIGDTTRALYIAPGTGIVKESIPNATESNPNATKGWELSKTLGYPFALSGFQEVTAITPGTGGSSTQTAVAAFGSGGSSSSQKFRLTSTLGQTAIGVSQNPMASKESGKPEVEMLGFWYVAMNVNQGDGDTDHDGLRDLDEDRYGTSRISADTDVDGLSDAWEVLYGLDPNDKNGVNGAEGDPDGDGVTNIEESRKGTNPRDTYNGIIKVNRLAAGSNDGNTWPNACKTLQDALTRAKPGDQIWVAAGTYRPDEVVINGQIVASNNPAATFSLLDGVEIYGGFAGGETERSQRSQGTNITTLTGVLDNEFSSTHVVTANGVGASAVLDGFVITGGKADAIAPFPDDSGAGLLVDGGSPQISHCLIRGNSAQYGGGVALSLANPKFTNCIFEENRALEGGGMVVADQSSVSLVQCCFRRNTAKRGGALSLTYSTVSARFVTIAKNGTVSGDIITEKGGGIHVFDSSHLTLANSIVWGNSAVAGSGYELALSLYSVVNVDHSILASTATDNDGTSHVTSANLVDSDPLLMDDGLHIQGGSPAIDAASMPLAPAEPSLGPDLDGDQRPTSWRDIGADEYHP